MAKPIKLEVPQEALLTVLERLGAMLALGLGAEASDDVKLAALAMRSEFAERAAEIRSSLPPAAVAQLQPTEVAA